MSLTVTAIAMFLPILTAVSEAVGEQVDDAVAFQVQHDGAGSEVEHHCPRDHGRAEAASPSGDDCGAVHRLPSAPHSIFAAR